MSKFHESKIRTLDLSLSMGTENPSFIFELLYSTDPITCKIVSQDIGYDIYFDERSMASIAHTEDWTWIQSSGVILPQHIIDEIGLRVESEYK